MPRVPRALIALTALAAALRLPTLGSQSLWLDEVLTGNLARGGLGDLFHVVAQQEANPPLFYLFEWVWTRVAGTSEFALRLPSALCGIALVPVGYAIGKKLAGERTAVALAALVAVHPLLVYYSQEARGYSAVALACAVGFFCFLDDRPLGWAIASVVALGCHYFAIFPVAIEAAILLWRGRRAAVAAVVVVGASLLPLVHEQLRGDHADNVTQGVGLATRTKGVVTSWIVGERGAAIDNLEWLGGALLLAGAVLAIRRREALMPALVGGGGAALMLLTALGGADYINNRNTIAVLGDRAGRPRDRLRGGEGRGVGGRSDLRRAPGRDDRCADRSRARARGLAERRAQGQRARRARHARLPVDPAPLVRAPAAPRAECDHPRARRGRDRRVATPDAHGLPAGEDDRDGPDPDHALHRAGPAAGAERPKPLAGRCRRAA